MSKSKVADSTAADVDVKMTDSPVKANTVDAAIVSLAQLEWSQGWNSRMGFIVPILLHVGSQTIQFVVLYYYYMFSLEALEDKFENAQFNMISTSINTAIATNTPLSKLTAIVAKNNTLGYPAGGSNMAFYGAVHKMCGLETSDLLINGLALVLFTGSVINDVHDIFSKLYLMVQLESDGDGPDETDEDGDMDITKPGAKNLITSMAVPLKLVAVVFILLPHLLCHTCIAFAGSKLISYGTSPFTVIKAFLKIYFISKFDVELYKALTSDNFLKYVKVSKWSIVKEKPGGLVDLWGTAFSTLVKVTIAVVWAYLCLYVVFTNLNEYRVECDAYYTHFKSSGYGHVIDYQKCIFGKAINPATNATFAETCGMKAFEF